MLSKYCKRRHKLAVGERDCTTKKIQAIIRCRRISTLLQYKHLHSPFCTSTLFFSCSRYGSSKGLSWHALGSSVGSIPIFGNTSLCRKSRTFLDRSREHWSGGAGLTTSFASIIIKTASSTSQLTHHGVWLFFALHLRLKQLNSGLAWVPYVP